MRQAEHNSPTGSHVPICYPTQSEFVVEEFETSVTEEITTQRVQEIEAIVTHSSAPLMII